MCLRCSSGRRSSHELNATGQRQSQITANIEVWRLAGEPGFEPGLTESESAGLPLTYSPRLAGGVWPSRRCGGLINKRAADANTFWQKNATGPWSAALFHASRWGAEVTGHVMTGPRASLGSSPVCRPRAPRAFLADMRGMLSQLESLHVFVLKSILIYRNVQQQRSQKKFGEKGRRWYSRANAKSRERLERPSGFARRHG